MVLDSTDNLASAIRAAWHRRSAFHANDGVTAYRVFHGYTEGAPGLSIDRYGTYAIINHKKPISMGEEELVAVLRELFPFEAIVLKTHQMIEDATGKRVKYLFGEPRLDLPVVREDDRTFCFDPDSLHTNGLYLDARPLRRWLMQNAQGHRILNLFAHTGSLGVTAKLGGATEVVHLDKSRTVVEKIKQNYRLNGLTPDDRGLLTGDLYFHLPRAIKWGQKFSGIILDPPPRVPPPPKAPKHRPKGQDFESLIALCCELLSEGGWLVCLYHDYSRSHEEHDQAIMTASRHGLTPFWREQADIDFPEVDPSRATRMTAFAWNP